MVIDPLSECAQLMQGGGAEAIAQGGGAESWEGRQVKEEIWCCQV